MKEEQGDGALVVDGEGAAFTAESEYDADIHLVVTVHEVGGRSACNFWKRVTHRSNGEIVRIDHRRMQLERVIEIEPEPLMLIGELNRYVQDQPSERDRYVAMRLEICFMRLAHDITKLINQQ